MDSLSQFARMLGVEWAEYAFSKFKKGRRQIPAEWPGTGTEALNLVSNYVDASFDSADCGMMVEEVQKVAQITWRELRSSKAEPEPQAHR